jgi:ubiquinone/menaquinone biosynthesis C-methylase UbiE
MSDKGDASRFDQVDAEKDPSYFVKFLDARKVIPEDTIIKRQIIEWLQPLEGKLVLDAGCGTGEDSRAIARLVGANGQVVAIDFSAAMIAEAKKRTEDASLPLEYREGDLMKLGFADASFDCARAERVLMHLSDARKGLEEMIRIVRSGGKIIASEVDQEAIVFDSPHIELTRRIIKSLVDATPSPRVGRSPARLMQQSGLQNVKDQATVINIPFSFVRIAISGHIDRCVQQEVISAKEADGWMRHLEETNAAGDFRWRAIVFTAMGEKP